MLAPLVSKVPSSGYIGRVEGKRLSVVIASRNFRIFPNVNLVSEQSLSDITMILNSAGRKLLRMLTVPSTCEFARTTSGRN